VLSNGLNPKYGLIDPYWMAASAIDEAIRNVISVGGQLERTALLDNFCWGNTDKPDRLGGLVRAALACYDMAKVLGTPFISGKDSLNNEFLTDDGESIAIPPTLLISAISVMADAKNAVTMDLKEPNGVLYVVGQTEDEMGGSVYYRIRGGQSLSVPKVDPVKARHTFESLAKAIEKRLVRACHDCSEGGLAVALAEMAFSGGRGARVDISLLPRSAEVKRSDIALFSESNTRFIVQVSRRNRNAFEEAMSGIPLAAIGKVTDDERFVIKGLDGRTVIDENIYALKESWQKTLRW
jgi:phosphoribosylformylglycinamidine (FGAM) synthase-like enzyme